MQERLYKAKAANAPMFVLAHGAGAGHDHPWMKRVAQGLAGRGVTTVTFNFPYTEAGKRIPDRRPVLEAAFADMWTTIAGKAEGPMFAGGKSMGGRIASQVAALGDFSPAPAGLVFFGYPLHPPGRPEKRRDRHLPDVEPPMLFVEGTRDPFASPEEMRELVGGLPRATLEIIEDGDHSLVATKKRDPGRNTLERVMDVTAEWMLSR